MLKNVRFAEVKLKDIESGVPFKVYHCRVGKGYDIFTEKMGVFEGVPMKIQLTINYTKTSYHSDEEAKIETHFLIRDFYAVFSIGEEEIEMRWDMSDFLSFEQAQNKILKNSMYGISVRQSMLSAKHLLPPQRRNGPLTFDGELTMNNIMYSFWKIATLMHLSLIGDYSWLYNISNPAGIFAVIHSAFTISPIAMKCYMSIVKSNERIAINQLTQVIEYCQTNDSFNNRPIEAVVAPIVSTIHECGKPELFRNIPMEVRTILVLHFNKENQHEIVAELNHYTDGRYHDLNDMSRWEL